MPITVERKHRTQRRSSPAAVASFRRQLRELSDSLTTGKPTRLRDARRAFEHDYVRYAIARVGDRIGAARQLGIGLSTLKEKIRKPRGARR